MDSVCTMGRMRLSVDALKDAHEQAHQHVLRIFKDKRFGNEEYNPDTHKDKLFEVSLGDKLYIKIKLS